MAPIVRDCSKMERLAEMVERFIRLRRSNQNETQHMKLLYASIRDLCLEEVYMMPSIRKILSEDELSGFILDFDTKLKGIVLRYDPKKSFFGMYLRRYAEYKAFNYLATTIKRRRLDEVALQAHFIELYDNNWEVDYDTFLDEACEDDWNALKVLRFICSKRSSFQRRLFIFICTMITSLSVETLEKACRCFGFDLPQTLLIHERIFEETYRTKRNDERSLYLQKRNRNWSMKLYYQGQFAAEGINAPDENERRAIRDRMEICQGRVENANRKLKEKRCNVKYLTIGRVLGISEGSVASSVFFVRDIIEAVLLSGAGRNTNSQYIAESGIMHMIEESRNAATIEVPHFSPLEAFNKAQKTSKDLQSDLEGQKTQRNKSKDHSKMKTSKDSRKHIRKPSMRKSSKRNE